LACVGESAPAVGALFDPIAATTWSGAPCASPETSANPTMRAVDAELLDTVKVGVPAVAMGAR
jgi:hypothetical protein